MTAGGHERNVACGLCVAWARLIRLATAGCRSHNNPPASYSFGMSDAISSLLGAAVGGLAVIGGAALQAFSAARVRRDEAGRQETLRREEADRQEEQRREERAALLQERRRLLARRYLYQVLDAVNSFVHRVDNWANRGGPRFAEGRHPGYWDITSLYVVARALGAERLLNLEGVYVELQALSSNGGAILHPRVVEEAVRKAFGYDLFYYHRLALAEAVLDRAGDEFRLLTYSEFLRRYEDPEWNLKSLLEPALRAFGALDKQRLNMLKQALTDVSKCIEELTTPYNMNGVEAL